MANKMLCPIMLGKECLGKLCGPYWVKAIDPDSGTETEGCSKRMEFPALMQIAASLAEIQSSIESYLFDDDDNEDDYIPEDEGEEPPPRAEAYLPPPIPLKP